MRKLLLLLLFSLSINAQTRVLFIGNSYTGYNGLATMVENVASSAGHSFSNSALTPGGATLYQHTQKASTYNQLASKAWDYVVIQAQSQEPSFPNNQVATQTLHYADELVDSIRSIVPCAQPTFYRTWGRENGDQWNCQFFPPLCTYAGMDSLLHLRYRMMADSNDAYLSPVGSVWKYIRDNDSTIQLYTSDGSHPSLAGSYVAACTFFTVFTRDDPTNITFNANLDTATANFIRQATKLVVYDSLSLWNVGKYDPSASLTYSMSADTLTYNISSTNTDSTYLLFGDGSGTSQAAGQHIYGLDDLFEVSLISFNCGKSDTTRYWVQSNIAFNIPQNDLSTPQTPQQLLQDWPNDLGGAHLINLQGQTLWHATPTNKNEFPNLPTGTYILHLNWTTGHTTSQKIGHFAE